MWSPGHCSRAFAPLEPGRLLPVPLLGLGRLLESSELLLVLSLLVLSLLVLSLLVLSLLVLSLLVLSLLVLSVLVLSLLVLPLLVLVLLTLRLRFLRLFFAPSLTSRPSSNEDSWMMDLEEGPPRKTPALSATARRNGRM